MKQKSLMAGQQFFANLIQGNGYYVDKTLILRELLDARHTVNLITRPRRFGKSLMLDMLSNFFDPDADHSLLDGLAITSEEALCREYMGQFPVLRLDLSGFNKDTFRGALNSFAMKIANLAISLRPICESEKIHPQDRALLESYMALADVRNFPKNTEDFEALLENAPAAMCRILREYHGKNVVVLIDEYDVPLYKAHLGGYYSAMAQLMQNTFESLLKTNPFLEFAVVCGCLNILQEGIFSGADNVAVWDADNTFSRDYFGFTDREVQDLLAYYSLPGVLEPIRKYYRGYRFGGEPVCCPWDIINYVGKCRKGASAKPTSYWVKSSGNDVFTRMLEDSTLQKDCAQLLTGGTIQKPIYTALTYPALDSPGDRIWTLLTATGYLTVQRTIGAPGPDSEEDGIAVCEDHGGIVLCALRIPNGEVRSLFRGVLRNQKQSAKRDP